MHLEVFWPHFLALNQPTKIRSFTEKNKGQTSSRCIIYKNMCVLTLAMIGFLAYWNNFYPIYTMILFYVFSLAKVLLGTFFQTTSCTRIQGWIFVFLGSYCGRRSSRRGRYFGDDHHEHLLRSSQGCLVSTHTICFLAWNPFCLAIYFCFLLLGSCF